MSAPGGGTGGRAQRHPAGLCGLCLHHRVVENRRGSTFYMCHRSRTDPTYPKYPPLPVLSCPGFEDGSRVPPGDEPG